jgi:hypothetical protein
MLLQCTYIPEEGTKKKKKKKKNREITFSVPAMKLARNLHKQSQKTSSGERQRKFCIGVAGQIR